MALAHEHAAEHDKLGRAETEFVCAQKGHGDDIASGLELSVGLERNPVTETVPDQCLPGLGKAYLRRDARIAYRGHRGSPCTSFSSGNDYQVGFGLGYTCGHCSDSTLCHEFHADACIGVDIAKIEDQLGQVLDGIDVMVRRGRDEGNARDGMARAGDDTVDLVSRQLAAFSRLCTLSDLDLYLFRVDEVFGCYTETSGSDLLYSAVLGRMEAFTVLSALTGVAARTEAVHGFCNGLVGTLADGAEGHGGSHEALYYLLHGLDFIDRNGIVLETEEIPEEQGLLVVVHYGGELLELPVVSGTGSQLQRSDRLGCPRVGNAILPEGVLADMWKDVGHFAVKSLRMHAGSVLCNPGQGDAADSGGRRTEILPEEVGSESYAFEYLRTAIGAYRADTHLAEYLLQTLVNRLDVVFPCSLEIELEISLLHKVVDDGERHVGVDRTGSVPEQKRGVHGLPYFSALHDQSCTYALLDLD